MPSSPGLIRGIVVSPSIGSVEPRSSNETTTSVSSVVPPFRTPTSISVGTWRDVLSVSGVSAMLPGRIVDRRDLRAAGRVAGGAGLARDLRQERGDLEVVEPQLDRLRQEVRRRHLARRAPPLQGRSSISSCGPRVEDVRGKELAHVGSDLLRRVRRAFVAERDLGLLDDRRDAVAAKLERELEVLLRVGELIRRVEALDAVAGGPRWCPRLDPSCAWNSSSVSAARIAEALEELGRELGRSGDERVEVAQVVLVRALLARVEAAADGEEQQDDDHDDADPECDQRAA